MDTDDPSSAPLRLHLLQDSSTKPASCQIRCAGKDGSIPAGHWRFFEQPFGRSALSLRRRLGPVLSQRIRRPFIARWATGHGNLISDDDTDCYRRSFVP